MNLEKPIKNKKKRSALKTGCNILIALVVLAFLIPLIGLMSGDQVETAKPDQVAAPKPAEKKPVQKPAGPDKQTTEALKIILNVYETKIPVATGKGVYVSPSKVGLAAVDGVKFRQVSWDETMNIAPGTLLFTSEVVNLTPGAARGDKDPATVRTMRRLPPYRFLLVRNRVFQRGAAWYKVVPFSSQTGDMEYPGWVNYHMLQNQRNLVAVEHAKPEQEPESSGPVWKQLKEEDCGNIPTGSLLVSSSLLVIEPELNPQDVRAAMKKNVRIKGNPGLKIIGSGLQGGNMPYYQVQVYENYECKKMIASGWLRYTYLQRDKKLQILVDSKTGK